MPGGAGRSQGPAGGRSRGARSAVLSAIQRRRCARGTCQAPGHVGGDASEQRRLYAQPEDIAPNESSPEATTESSPGCQSWVNPKHLNSPVGTAESSPGRQSWVGFGITDQSRHGRLRIFQDNVLGWDAHRKPRVTCWDILSRPCGTLPQWEWVPRTYVLGYSQPSLAGLPKRRKG